MGRFAGLERPGLRLARFRFRATFGQRSGGYLVLVLLIALVGGLAMGSIAAARRTASSFPVYWASTNPSNLVGVTGILNPEIGSNAGYDAGLIRRIARVPHVDQVESQAGIDFLPLQRDGLPLNAPNFYTPAAGNGYGSVDGLYFDQDRVRVTQGKMADPNRVDELMLSASGASGLGVHVGSVLPVGIYTNTQTQLPAFGTASVKPIRIVDEKVVGIVTFNSSIIEDQVDLGSTPNNLFTPALTRQLLSCCVNYTQTGVRVRGGTQSVAAAQVKIDNLLPGGFPPFQNAEPAVIAKAQRAIKPEAIALGAFGVIVALAALLLAAQVTGRQLRRGGDDRQVLRGLGASPAMVSADGLVGIVGSVLLGALLAGAVAIGISPLAPLGPVRPVYPQPGVNFDWTVLGFGFLVLVATLSVTAVVIGFRAAPHRIERRGRFRPDRPSRLVTAAGAFGLPPPALAGVRFAVESGAGNDSVPVRSAILGAAMAVVVVVATVTFGASLDSLVSHPALYGWNWDYALASGGDIPQQQVTKLLDADRYIAHWSGVYTATVEIRGLAVPALGENPNTQVAPPILSGHGLEGEDQAVLGAFTLQQLHAHLNETVLVNTGVTKSRLKIVGTAAMPTIGSSGGQHLEMGTGAVVSSTILPAVAKNPFDDPIAGPNAILVRLRAGSNQAAARRSLNEIAQATTNNANFGVQLTPVQRPAEILNYRSLGNTPAYLGAGLAVGAVSALALTLVSSVRRKQRDLALLKTLGLTRGQLAATVAWQSTIAVAIGTVVGVPFGIAFGRWLWDLFADNIHAVPAPSVPVFSVLLIAIGALVLANAVAAFPGRLAARTPTALLLRSE